MHIYVYVSKWNGEPPGEPWTERFIPETRRIAFPAEIFKTGSPTGSHYYSFTILYLILYFYDTYRRRAIGGIHLF